MDLKTDIDWKSLIIGAAISATLIIMASRNGWDILFACAAIGFIYVGYNAKNLLYGAALGAVAALPTVYIAFMGTMGSFTGFFATTTGNVVVIIIILLVGAFIGFVGAWAKRSRVKAKEEYEKQQKKGKNKKKNKKKNNN